MPTIVGGRIPSGSRRSRQHASLDAIEYVGERIRTDAHVQRRCRMVVHGRRRTHVVTVAGAVMMREGTVAVSRHLVSVSRRMHGELDARDAAAVGFGGVRHAGPAGENQHQTGKEGQQLSHSIRLAPQRVWWNLTSADAVGESTQSRSSSATAALPETCQSFMNVRVIVGIRAVHIPAIVCGHPARRASIALRWLQLPLPSTIDTPI
jgi:hypothetical protein